MQIIELEKVRVESAKDLQVFQKAFSVSMEIHRATLSFPKIEQYALADQLRRASKSVCANIAEGFGRQKKSKPEFARFLNIALGSVQEVDIWLLYAKELGYIPVAQYEEWCEEYQAILKMLTKLKNNL